MPLRLPDPRNYLSQRLWLKRRPKHASPSDVTLSELPAELILEIIQYLNEYDLYYLGLTCHNLHYIAYSTFLEKHNILSFSTTLNAQDVEPPMSLVIPPASRAHPVTWPIIHASLWIRSLRKLTIIMHTIERPATRLLEDVKNVKRLVRRLNINGIEECRIDFSQMSWWVWTRRESPKNVLPRAVWVKALAGLLDLIIERGVLTLEVNGGSELPRPCSSCIPGGLEWSGTSSYADEVRKAMEDLNTGTAFSSLDATLPPMSTLIASSSDEDPSKASLRPTKEHRNSPWSLRKTSPSVGNEVPSAPPLLKMTTSFTPPPPPCRLQHLRIKDSMLLQYSFYPWTLAVLSKLSSESTLTQLSLNCDHIPATVWADLLSTISLPHLTRFEQISSEFRRVRKETHLPKCVDLMVFLERHPSIEELHLQGVDGPERQDLGLDAPLPGWEQPVLPRLRRVMAGPLWISCLVGLLERHPESMLKLEEIGITTEYLSIDDGREYARVYKLLDSTLWRIAVAEVFRTRQIALAFALLFQQGIVDWLNAHLDGTSVITSLGCVETVVIYTRYYLMFEDSRGSGHRFAAWAALFPRLKCVRFVPLVSRVTDGYDDFMKSGSEGVLQSLAQQCSMLERVEMVGSLDTVLLDRYRQ